MLQSTSSIDWSILKFNRNKWNLIIFFKKKLKIIKYRQSKYNVSYTVDDFSQLLTPKTIYELHCLENTHNPKLFRFLIYFSIHIFNLSWFDFEQPNKHYKYIDDIV